MYEGLGRYLRVRQVAFITVQFDSVNLLGHQHRRCAKENCWPGLSNDVDTFQPHMSDWNQTVVTSSRAFSNKFAHVLVLSRNDAVKDETLRWQSVARLQMLN